MKKTIKSTLPLCALSALVLCAYANGLTAQSPLSIVQSTNANLFALADSISAISEAPTKTETSLISHHFEDVISGVWYEIAVDYVVSFQIMSPLSNTQFAPENDITRGILATTLTNSLHAELGEIQTAFPDLAQQWYHDSAHWCAEQGLMSGYPNGNFGGNDPMIREQLAVTLFRYAQFQGLDPAINNANSLQQYSDGKEVSSFAQNAVAWCLKEEIFHSEDSLRPKENASRGEVAYAIYQINHLIEENQ